MAWYYGTYCCGHEGRTNIVGPLKNREWIKENHFEKVCPECWEKKILEDREKANIEAIEKAKEMELPELQGTEKQVAWANTLRQKMIDKINGLTDEYIYCLKVEKVISDKRDIKDFENFVLSQTSARWFIDNKSGLISAIKDALKIIKLKDDVAEIPEDIQSECTVYPENKITNAVAEISFNSAVVTVKFEKNKQFIELVKSLGYKWDGASWYLDVNKFNGSVEDRAIELGNKLLIEGFHIFIYDNIVRQKAIDGKYEQECKKWIGVRADGEHEGKLSIIFKERNDRIYNASRTLPSSVYSNPSVVVNPKHYKEVVDFAEVYGFKFTDKAKEVIKRQEELEREVLIVRPKRVKKVKEVDGLEEILNSGDEIIDDLKD